MKEQNLIHVRIEPEEALDSKKEILSSQMSLLMILKRIKKYKSLRTEELKTKENLHKKIKEINAEIGKLQSVLPKLKIPELLHKEKEVAKVNKKIIADDDLEFQLQEIQNKLSAIR
ncbi:MAG: hypothetical protein KJ646_05280 [Nanoarchaeota archaeon]|nr:hypothetical protein [Nanoarchaeota archaeon]